MDSSHVVSDSRSEADKPSGDVMKVLHKQWCCTMYKAAAAIASNQEWRETRPAQFSCPEAEIVARVREVLARHEVKWG